MRWINYSRAEILIVSTYEDKDRIPLTEELLKRLELNWDLVNDDILQISVYDYNVRFERIGAAALKEGENKSESIKNEFETDFDEHYAFFLIDLFKDSSGEELKNNIANYRDTSDFAIIEISEKEYYDL